MNYYSEKDIQDIVARVIAKSGLGACHSQTAAEERSVPVEISARHVHLDQASLEALFGRGYQLTHKRGLSQPGQYLAEERVKLVTPRGELANVAILGPLRRRNQVEISLTDARVLGLSPPVRLSGDLDGAADIVIVGPKGAVTAPGSVIVAKAHVHMTPADAEACGVKNGEHVSVTVGAERSITLNDVIVRIDASFALAVHIDFDEANAAQVGGGAIEGRLRKNR